MTVPTTARRAGPFNGNGVATSFPFTFKVFTSADVQVVKTSTANVDTTLVLDTDYSVTLNPDQDATPGGTITYPVSGTPLAAGEKLSAVGATDYDQQLDLSGGGKFDPVVIENALDRQVFQIQQLAEKIDRTLLVSVATPTAVDTTLPAPESNNLLGWNAAADGLQNVDPTTLATIVAFGTAVPDIFTGDGATTAFTLTANPAALGNLDVAVGGVTQLPGIDYFWTSGTSLTFAAAPANGVKILVRYIQALPQGSTDSAASAFVQSGSGAVIRNAQDKLREAVSVKDFGAVGDGVADDTTAFVAALAASLCVRVPRGTYKITSTITVGYGKWLVGDGQEVSIINCASAANMIEMVSAYSGVEKLKLVGDSASRAPTVGIKLYGAAYPCIHNTVRDVTIQDTQRGIVLDGYTNTAYPCYWNNIERVLVLKPAVDGVLLTKSGAGDSPNANKFDKVHVYSNGSSISGHGIYVQNGNYWNSFNDCESGLSITTPTACFRLGAGAARTLITNLYCETAGAIVNVQLDAGSSQTYLDNLLAMSGGSAIYDVAGTGDYKCINAGYPNSYYLGQSVLQSAQVGKVLFDYDGAATSPAASTLYEHRYRNAAPASGAFNRGSVVWNTNVGASNGPTGWICTTGGTPGTWQAFGDRYLEGTVTFNPGLIANGAQCALVSATVTGAALGDIVDCSNSVDMQGLNLQGYVSATDTVKVFASNSTGAGVTLSSGTVYLRVRKR